MAGNSIRVYQSAPRNSGNWPQYVAGTRPIGEDAAGRLNVAEPAAGRATYLAQGWPNQLFFAQQYMKYLFFPMREQDPTRDALQFNFDRDPAHRFAMGQTQDPTPDLREF